MTDEHREMIERWEAKNFMLEVSEQVQDAIEELMALAEEKGRKEVLGMVRHQIESQRLGVSNEKLHNDWVEYVKSLKLPEDYKTDKDRIAQLEAALKSVRTILEAKLKEGSG